MYQLKDSDLDFEVERQGPDDIWVAALDANDPDAGAVGIIKIQRLEGNVVITVERMDEAEFGPVSLVVR